METKPDLGMARTIKEAHKKNVILETVKQELLSSTEKLPEETRKKIVSKINTIFLERKNEIIKIAEQIVKRGTANPEDIKNAVLRYIDDELIQDIPTNLTSLINSNDAELDLVVTNYTREFKDGDVWDKVKNKENSTTDEQNEYILELVGEMHDILQDIKKYKNNDIFERADKKGINKLLKIREVIQQNLHEYHAAKIKLKGGLSMSDGSNDGEREMLIGLVTDQLLKTYAAFLKPPVSKKEEEFEAKIEQLDTKSRDEMEKKWKEEKGILLDEIEQGFKAEIQSLTKTQLLDLERDNTPGLLRIDTITQPETEDIQIRKLSTQKPPKKPNRVSGFFRRIFG